MSRIKAYYELTKPGIIYGNLLTATAGYLLASKLTVIAGSFAGIVVGTGLVVGGACVFNNLYDRDIDRQMKRTRDRPSVNGAIGVRGGLIYGVVLALGGFVSLALLVNWPCVVIGLIGLADYALAYTLSKRRTYHSTLIGSLSGATPIIGGYVAYSGTFNATALILGLMMLLWQMPHFYAIALYRESDYRKAKVPVLPVVRGRQATTRAIAVYSLLFVVATITLYFYSKLHIYYLVIMGVTALAWALFNLRGLNLKEVEGWAKRSFRYSLLVVMIMSVLVALR